MKYYYLISVLGKCFQNTVQVHLHLFQHLFLCVCEIFIVNLLLIIVHTQVHAGSGVSCNVIFFPSQCVLYLCDPIVQSNKNSPSHLLLFRKNIHL